MITKTGIGLKIECKQRHMVRRTELDREKQEGRMEGGEASNR